MLIVVPTKVLLASGPFVVSSQVIHDFQGVAPPAQLELVPFRLTQLPSTFRSLFTSTVVVPPPVFLSYALSAGPIAGTSKRTS